MDPKYRQIIENATKLAERSISAFESEKKLQEIEPKFNELSKKAQDEESKNEKFRLSVNKMADTLITRGVLEESNKVAFVNSVADDHEELIKVAIRLSSEMKVESFGKVGEEIQGTELDAFERLAIE